MLRKGNSLIVDALSEGMILHGEQNSSEVEGYRGLVRRSMKTLSTIVVPPG
ncbi:MAG: hypothetical protein N3E44_01215 [Candidatus Bathyarchaeota archaeon]|nr:hypothetical protein [Candidatus Bathyarchaeota archaeon]